MREVLFRAKEKADGEWVYGWYCRYPFGKWPLKDAIIPSEEAEIGCFRFVEVDHSTVWQYTGLTDKNGKRIFEGDVVVIEADCIPSFMLNRYVVVWDNDQAAYKLLKDNTIYDLPMGRMEIIGNIHDNPELLGAHDGGPED